MKALCWSALYNINMVLFFKLCLLSTHWFDLMWSFCNRNLFASFYGPPTPRWGWCSSFYLWINCYFFIEKKFNNNNKKIFLVLLSSPNHSSIGSSHFSHPLFDLIYRMGLGPSRVNFPPLYGWIYVHIFLCKSWICCLKYV